MISPCVHKKNGVTHKNNTFRNICINVPICYIHKFWFYCYLPPRENVGQKPCKYVGINSKILTTKGRIFTNLY